MFLLIHYYEGSCAERGAWKPVGNAGLPLVKPGLEAGTESVRRGGGLRKEGPPKPNVSSRLGWGTVPLPGAELMEILTHEQGNTDEAVAGSFG